MHAARTQTQRLGSLALLGIALASPCDALASPPEAPFAAAPPPSAEVRDDDDDDAPPPGVRPKDDQDSDLVPPLAREQVALPYPSELLKLDPPPQGTIKVRFVVTVGGQVRELELIDGVHPILDALALSALATITFDPATYQGEPVEVLTVYDIPVSLPATAQPAPGVLGTQDETPIGGKAGPVAVGAGGEQTSEELPGPPLGGHAALRCTVLRAGDRVPLAGAVVLVTPGDLRATESVASTRARARRRASSTAASEPVPAWVARAVTGSDGSVTLTGLPAGLVRVTVQERDSERGTWLEELVEQRQIQSRYFVAPIGATRYRTSVVSSREPEPSRHVISAEEIQALPGTQGDALKSIQNFPGVARPPFGAGLLVIRGAAPSDSRTLLGHHEIPQLFHFGGLTSVFNSDAIAQIDFIPGNFDVRYGDAIGGIVNVSVRKGRRDGHHGYLDGDLFDLGGVQEGRLGKGSYFLSLRRSWIDSILRGVLPRDLNLDFKQAPRYFDYQALLDQPLAGGNLSLRWFGSDDRFALVTGDNNDTSTSQKSGFGTTIGFHRVDAVFERDSGPWHFLITPSYRHEYFSGNASDLFSFRTVRDEFSGRAEVSRRLTKSFSLRMGADIQTGRFTIDARSPAVPVPGVGFNDEQQRGVTSGTFALPGVYATGIIALSPRVTFLPGVRATARWLVSRGVDFEPRLRLHIMSSDSNVIKLGLGLVAQVPDVFEFNPVWGNPKIRLERGVHSSVGFEQTIAALDVSVEATVFHKYLWDLAIPSFTLFRGGSTVLPERFGSTGEGQVGGLELLVRREFGRKLFGWLSYTYSRAFYRELPGDPLVPFAFDQPHILTALLVYRLPRRWQIGGRFRLVSGNPYTPVDDCVSDISTGECIDVRGPTNSSRLPTFHQLDLRIDKTWVRDHTTWMAYLDVQNVYNRRNVEAYTEAWNRHTQVPLAGLPILPSVGLRLSW